MITERKVALVRSYYVTIQELDYLHPLDSLSAFVRGLITAWCVDGTINGEQTSELMKELEQVSNEVRNRFENNEG